MTAITDGKIQVINKHGQAYGLRDRTGFLFFFTDVRKFDGQEDRYRDELEAKQKLVDYVLAALLAEQGNRAG